MADFTPLLDADGGLQGANSFLILITPMEDGFTEQRRDPTGGLLMQGPFACTTIPLTVDDRDDYLDFYNGKFGPLVAFSMEVDGVTYSTVRFDGPMTYVAAGVRWVVNFSIVVLN